MSTNITLPLPPSTNAIWRSNRGRVHRSKRYLTWARTAGWELKLQKPSKMRGPVAITVAAGKPDARRRDLDNVATKALLENLLVAHKVIADDSLVASLSSRWDAAVAPGRVAVTIAAAN